VKSSYKLLALRRLTQDTKVFQKRLAQLTEQANNALRSHSTSGQNFSPLLHQCNLDAESLKKGVLELADRLSAETVHLDPVIDELQFRVKQIRMLPCATIYDGFERLVRDVAKEEEKTVNLVIEGEDTELDKKVLEVLKPCLIHLLRNAVSHGIERPDEREAHGKPKTGTIWLRAFQRSGRVVIEVQDDGHGIDVEKVKQVALKKKFANFDELFKMPEQEILGFIFAPGLTTSPTVTDVSGRGVGLDVVRTEAEKLKGQVHLSSRPGQGTTLTVELPLTIAIMQVLLVEVEGKRFGLPLSSIEESVKVRSSEVLTLDGRTAIRLREQTVPVIKLAEILGLPARHVDEELSRPKVPEKWCAVIASSQGRRVGFLVDQILGEEEIFIKNLGMNLGKIKNISGATILGTGEIVLILDVGEVIGSSKSAPLTSFKKDAPANKPQRRILVVEDSLTTRELEKSILGAHGYAVETAVDGLDALEKLSQGEFHLVVCDIEMPRMNGFEFCKTLRQQPEHKDLPVVFVTSFGKEDQKRRGIEVGAQAYIVKSAFDQANLLEVVERLIGLP